MTLRERVYVLDRGRCVGCKAKLRRNGSVWEWQVHHCLKQQWLTARGVSVKSTATARLCVLLCKECHEGHEQQLRRTIPASRLPARVRSAVSELGPWAEDRLARYHREA